MKPKSTTCTVCGNPFVRKHDHLGKANVCLNCGGQDVEPLMAEVSWEGKQTPIIRVTTAAKAKAFNKALRRSGPGPLSSIVSSRETDTKIGSGAEGGAGYNSNLGEKRNVKR